MRLCICGAHVVPGADQGWGQFGAHMASGCEGCWGGCLLVRVGKLVCAMAGAVATPEGASRGWWWYACCLVSTRMIDCHPRVEQGLFCAFGPLHRGVLLGGGRVAFCEAGA